MGSERVKIDDVHNANDRHQYSTRSRDGMWGELKEKLVSTETRQTKKKTRG